MATTTLTSAASAEKFARRTSQAGPDYEAGIRNPRRPWRSATLAAQDTYKVAMTDALARNAFGSGVSRASDDDWQSQAIELGAARYAPGASAAQGKYQAAMEPVLSVIQRTELGPKYAKGDPRNYSRVQKLGDALHKLRLGTK